ncbi:hemophore-related protein [Mycolicibacterium cosmeticum]|uniref:Exported protein n=1 Tax=Mycolicibacterium cosmeticum TaxID=258533 RepID=W9B0V3_MYCCO|nr:heme-binding protein [Mycolicibacterium cosmeticum]TLH70623.1 hemophore-related protein [Mycolicibacterium cosmeticum]CDO11428.1 exported protein [Mycolicibacterium cosmeticum]
MNVWKRTLCVAAASAAVLVGTAAPAPADPPPNCTAADLAGITAGVSASTSAYLFTHPDVNAFFTGLKGQDRDAKRAQVRAYFDANPQVQADFQGIRQPLQDFRDRCRG